MTQEVELDTSFPSVETTEKQYNVWVAWSQPKMPWSMICSMVIDVFGLPGDRFNYHTTDHYMCFKFKSEKDHCLCEILLSEYVTK